MSDERALLCHGPDGSDRFTRSCSRELDRHAIGEHGVPSLLLMEHASIGIAIECLRWLPAHPARPARVEVLCGPGNNGGDGLACARHLFNSGVDVTIWELVPAGERRAGSDAAVHLEIARRMGIRILPVSGALPPSDPPPELRIDAIFGTGLTRAPEGIHRLAIEHLVADPVPVLSVDIPSGLDADLGIPLERAVEATVTVTLGLPKSGFLAPGAGRFTGELRCVPIGVSWRDLPEGLPAFPPVPHRLRPAGDRFEIATGA